MKKKSRRKSHVIRLLLVFLMLFTMMPASIFAFADMDYSSDQQEDKAGNSRVKDDSVIVNEYEVVNKCELWCR